ncbi:sulfite exporter TauE/SafE family protein [Collimonas sp.]|jgi:sulfite exporter TauE/SafE|uniref:sulfite exporter TauE/SafE family protein n=1 Tax=Collimonas sp. TaxID=1963772 RepID=UPI002D12CEA4|nr:sulfite exporter TauE/SafE family protein [Collimonas sp.]HWW04693.1 sulfite exporter TauE/SafE family protein [Collimonas sp.]
MNLLPIFLIGMLGSIHCVGMCGGIVSALSVVAMPSARVVPLQLVAGDGAAVASGPSYFQSLSRVLAYNSGRLGSYALAGALAGGLAQSVRVFASLASLQIGAYWLMNLILIALGLHLMDAWRGLNRLEAFGQIVWRRIQPAIKLFLPMDNPAKALMLGALWGWLPCGMVYSVLLTAMLSGDALSGAKVMLAFGLGTLPMLFMLGVLGLRLKRWSLAPRLRIGGGLIVLLFGIAGVARLSNGLSLGWLDAICLSPVGAGH